MDELRQEKVKKFEEFLDCHLKPKLVLAISERDKVFEQQKTFSDLKRNIQNLEKNSVSNTKTLVNLGSEMYAQAEVQIKERTRQIALIKSHIKLVCEGIRELLELPLE